MLKIKCILCWWKIVFLTTNFLQNFPTRMLQKILFTLQFFYCNNVAWSRGVIPFEKVNDKTTANAHGTYVNCSLSGKSKVGGFGWGKPFAAIATANGEVQMWRKEQEGMEWGGWGFGRFSSACHPAWHFHPPLWKPLVDPQSSDAKIALSAQNGVNCCSCSIFLCTLFTAFLANWPF